MKKQSVSKKRESSRRVRWTARVVGPRRVGFSRVIGRFSAFICAHASSTFTLRTKRRKTRAHSTTIRLVAVKITVFRVESVLLQKRRIAPA